MQVRRFCKTPQISEISAYVVIVGIDNPRAEGGEKILLFGQNLPSEPLSLGSLWVPIRPEAVGNPPIAANLKNLIFPLVEQVTIPMVAHCLKQQMAVDSITIDSSETAFLVVPSGGEDIKKRTFHLKTACVIPIAFLPASLGMELNRSKELHWIEAGEIMKGYRLHGGEDEEYLTKMVLRAHLRG